MEPLSGKVAIVTGASSGIGEAIARALVILGVHVIGVARRKWKLDEIGNSLEGSKGSFYPLYGDLRPEGDILNVFKFAAEKFGGIDILVNNAGIAWAEPILNSTTEHYREILELNLLAAAIATREGVRSILKRGNNGHIVNIMSNLAVDPLLEPCPLSLYGASKSGLHTMAEVVREEIATNQYPIKMIGIYPGLVKTEFAARSGDDPDEIYTAPHLVPEDVASSVIFALQAPGNVAFQRVQLVPLFGR